MLSTLVMLHISVLNCSNRHFHCCTVQTLELVNNNLRLYYTVQCSVDDLYGNYLLQNCHYTSNIGGASNQPLSGYTG